MADSARCACGIQQKPARSAGRAEVDAALRMAGRRRSTSMVGKVSSALFGEQDLVPVTTQIVGVLGHKAPDNYFIFRRDYLVEMYRHFPHRVYPEYDVGFYWIKADSVSSILSIMSEVDETFANSSYETMTDSEVGFFTSLMSRLNMLFALAKVICVIVLITMTLVAANTAAMSVRERRREVATMRALGFARRQVAAMLIGESRAIALIGRVGGCPAAYT